MNETLKNDATMGRSGGEKIRGLGRVRSGRGRLDMKCGFDARVVKVNARFHDGVSV